MDAPVLDTPRLRLRAFTLEDWPALCAIWGDAEVVRFIGGRAFTSTEVWSRLLRDVGHWRALGFGYWAVCQRERPETLIGVAGLADFKRGLGDDFDGRPEAGWVFAPSAWGQGYAGEALAAVMGWADEARGAAEVVCIIEPAHAASLRVAAKAGFVAYGRTTFAGAEVVKLRRARSVSG